VEGNEDVWQGVGWHPCKNVCLALGFPFMPLFSSHRIGRSRLVFCPMYHVESASIGLWFKTGSRYEPTRLHGAAHFIEHLLFKGTRKRTALEITEGVESLGGDLNAFTSEEMTCYFARIAVDHLPLVADVLFDMLWKSSFQVKELERERGVILDEILMYDDQPHMVALEHCNLGLWPENSLGRPIMGTGESVRQLNRKELMEFWRRHYRPSSLVVSVAGNVKLDQMVELLRPYVEPPRNSGAGRTWTPVRLPNTRTPYIIANQRPVQQCHFSLGIRGFPRKDPRRYTEKVLSVILGENMSSRLFQSVREQHGLAYSVHSSTAHYFDTGAFYIHAGTDPDQFEKCLGLVADELSDLRRKRPSARELRRAKDYIIGQMKLGMESTSSRMMWMGECMIGLDTIIQPQQVMEEIESVTLAPGARNWPKHSSLPVKWFCPPAVRR
jgi:predicted Zn-dependent peptidase